MEAPENFYNLLFEVSNEIRHRSLLLLKEKPMRITEIAKQQKLNHPEIRRHLTRLREVGLIKRDADGYYHLTSYGETSIILLKELEFLSANSAYFKDHSLSDIPIGFLKQIGELGECTGLSNAMDFLRCTENLFKQSREHVWILVDQFPMNSLSTIVATINRGVKFRIIEPRERVLNPDLDALTSEEVNALSRTRMTPLVEQRMLDEVGVLLFLSEACFVLAFPTVDGQHDFKGFTSTHDSALNWCRGLFQFYWGEAEQRTSAVDARVEHERAARSLEPSERIVVVGQERPEVDAQAVQDAVDNYDKVILKGTFNFGSSNVRISRGVDVRGDGRVDDIPSTTIYKKGWRFPFTEFDSVFNVDAKGAEVTIENIHFTDFNHVCIRGVQSGGLNVKNNRITLMTGYGRGMTYGAFGEVVIGVWVQGSEPSVFEGRVNVEGNHIDFARGGAFGGFLSRDGIEEDPEHRPDLFNHEYYMGFGVAVHQASGSVDIVNNVIRNTNARGIAVTGCLQTADVSIWRNTVESDVYGSYPFSSPEAGAGILAQSAWGFPSPGFNVEVEENILKFDKLNYCGIKVLGPVMNRGRADKLRGGAIRNNRIRLRNGYEGIHVRKCDEFTVSGNQITGETYYGIRVSGHRRSGMLDLSSMDNRVEGNTMDELLIRAPDDYSDKHADGRMFAAASGGSSTSHIWLGKFTKSNTVKIRENETVIDEGEENRIEHR